MDNNKDLIKNYEKAIELLKKFSFYDLNDKLENHCLKALEVQHFLKDIKK